MRRLVATSFNARQGAAPMAQVFKHDLAKLVVNVELLVIDESNRGMEVGRDPFQKI